MFFLCQTSFEKIWQGSELTNPDLKKLNSSKNDAVSKGNELFIYRMKLLCLNNSVREMMEFYFNSTDAPYFCKPFILTSEVSA